MQGIEYASVEDKDRKSLLWSKATLPVSSKFSGCGYFEVANQMINKARQNKLSNDSEEPTRPLFDTCLHTRVISSICRCLARLLFLTQVGPTSRQTHLLFEVACFYMVQQEP